MIREKINRQSNSTGKTRRGSESCESLDIALDVVTESLQSIERDVLETQALIRELDVRLQTHRDRLSDYRKTMLTRKDSASSVLAPAQDPRVQLRFHCFGLFEVFRGQQRLPLLRCGKGCAILKYLATMHWKPVPRDVLLEVLWPDTDPHIGNNRFRAAIHHLRQTFAMDDSNEPLGNVVTFLNGAYFLNPELNIWTDVQDFEMNWQAGLRLERAGRLDEAISSYRQAEALYRGELLEEDVLEEWTLCRREELKDTYLTILDKLSRYWLETNEVDRAIEGWKQVLAHDPWREDVYRQLMVCFVNSEQRGLALRWYERCVQILKSQLGLEPEPRTIALYERIRAGKEVSECVVRQRNSALT